MPPRTATVTRTDVVITPILEVGPGQLEVNVFGSVPLVTVLLGEALLVIKVEISVEMEIEVLVIPREVRVFLVTFPFPFEE